MEKPHPKEAPLFRTVPQQAIADVLRTLPTPITITHYLDAVDEQSYYLYQVGTPTGDNPFGLGTGATTDFLKAVRLSLGIAMGNVQEEPGAIGQIIETRPRDRQPLWMPNEWIVPEVERGQVTSEQAAEIGLPFRHHDTGETITEWIERRMQKGETRGAEEGEEEIEQELISVLRHLPIAVTINKWGGGYAWLVLEQSGITENFVTSVENGLRSLLLQLIEHQQSTQVRYRSFGDRLFQTEDGDSERVLTDTNGVRVVTFEHYGVIKLFRVDWTDQDGTVHNKAIYTLGAAMDTFQGVLQRRQQGEL